MGEQSSRPQWWRFTGIAGFKRIMPDKAIRYAEERGYKWTRWYVPVCDDCPRYCSLNQKEPR